MSTGRLNILKILILTVIATACSAVDGPQNLEPIIELGDACNVTRTEAVVPVNVELRGHTGLSFLTLHYGIEHSETDQTIDCHPDISSESILLTGLRPGRKYFCYAEGGSSTASILSNTINFSTLPNNVPVMSSLTVLSTGPIGIIVMINIDDDGGEPITEAGCEVTDLATGHTTRSLLSSDQLQPGTHRLHIPGLTVNTAYRITPFAVNEVGIAKGESLDYTTSNSIVLESAGELALLLGASTDQLTSLLTISGKMNGDDFRFLRGLLTDPTKKVCDVDLTSVTICAGGASYDGSRYTVDDVITTDLFADCINLRNISLPASATYMERDALARCTLIENLTIPANITGLLPSSGCMALKAIEVSAANSNFASVDGVLFDSDVTQVLWFPLGKTGHYSLPPTVTSIAKSAFAGTSITSLEIPPSVTEIGNGAFAGSSLLEISLPDNITIIPTALFQNSSVLQTVKLGSSTELLGSYVFDGTSITDLYISAKIPPVTSADSFINKQTSITKVCTLHVPAGCKTIYRYHSSWGQFSKIEEF